MISSIVVGVIVWSLVAAEPLPPACDNEIYCHGPLLHTVQMARLFHDSKTFVDRKLRFDAKYVLANFTDLMNATKGQPSKSQLVDFVERYFDSEGLEFDDWSPGDWKKDPSFISQIKDPQLQQWAVHLHEAWKFLGRKIKDDVRLNPHLYSIIYVANPFIIPGGRFREFYYWDSYWIVQGLLISEMNHTVKGMLSNFLDIVNEYGFVPNGGRIYYGQRSQPPMLISMMERYVDATGDVEFLRKNIHLLEKELHFWMDNRAVNISGHTLLRFDVQSDGPRPESYREDYEMAQKLPAEDRQEFYVNMKSGAESGWDFSSRWFVANDSSNLGNLFDTRVRYILPVDLNAFLCMNARLLSQLFTVLEDHDKAEIYRQKYEQLKEAIKQILWDEEQGSWFDYNLLNGTRRPFFYGSNFAPLWAGCWHNQGNGTDSLVDRLLHYLDRHGVTEFFGGVPTSMRTTGQQWDFPNGWPPLQQLMIVALKNTGHARAKDLAFKLARKWILNNFEAFTESWPNAMFEKYDVTVIGLPGGGGEYDVQLGFGWTNGVALELLKMYGSRLNTIKDSDEGLTSWKNFL